MTTPAGTSPTSAADQFTYTAAPAVTGLSPTSGPAAGGTLVTITGTDFTGATAVDFGTTAATNVTVVNSTEITADSPAGTGTVDVTVTTPGGTSATSPADQFTYTAAAGGHEPEPDQRSDRRRHFGDDHRHRASPAPRRSTSETTAATNLTVVNSTDDHGRQPGGHRHRGRDRDHPGRHVGHLTRRSVHLHRGAPAVTSLSPTSGPTAGGTLVTITGTEFTGATAVDFGTTAATNVTVVNSTDDHGRQPGGHRRCGRHRDHPGGTSATSAADQFTYTVAPAVTSLSPTSGPTAGGTLVTITGTSFTGATAVDFGTTAATNLTVVNSTEITADSPAGTGTVDVTVTTPVGTSATSTADKFTYTVLSPGVYAVGTTLYVVGANTSKDYALISPPGGKLDGSTGLAVVASLNNVITVKAFSQTFTAIDIFGYGGNDVFLLSPTLTLPTTVVEGNGNNYLLLAGGNDSVTLGSGSNHVFGGNGNKTITDADAAGTSAYISLGNGNDTISSAPAMTPSPSATATTMSRPATATTMSRPAAVTTT